MDSTRRQFVKLLCSLITLVFLGTIEKFLVSINFEKNVNAKVKKSDQNYIQKLSIDSGARTFVTTEGVMLQASIQEYNPLAFSNHLERI